MYLYIREFEGEIKRKNEETKTKAKELTPHRRISLILI